MAAPLASAIGVIEQWQYADPRGRFVYGRVTYLGFGTVAERRRSADMHICRIRRKLKTAGGTSLQIVTVYGQGYLLKLVSEPQAGAPRVAWTV